MTYRLLHIDSATKHGGSKIAADQTFIIQWLPNLVKRLMYWSFLQNTKIIFLLRHQTKPILGYNISVVDEAPRRPRSAGAE